MTEEAATEQTVSETPAEPEAAEKGVSVIAIVAGVAAAAALFLLIGYLLKSMR